MAAGQFLPGQKQPQSPLAKLQTRVVSYGSEIAISRLIKASLKRDLMGLSDITTIALDVLAYLNRNAEAGDTFEGIVEWWLPDQKIRQGIVEVREALDELAANQLICEYKRPDTRVHYRINQSKETEIRALVEQKG